MDNFNKALEFLFAAEGGYSNRKNDTGGATNLGITQSTFDSAIKNGIIHTDIKDVRYITKDLAIQIYKHEYWDSIKADQLPSGIDVALFDMTVNSGKGNSVKTLQKTLGVTQDGVIGKNTLNAINSYQGDLVKDFNNQRREFYDSIIENNKKLREEDIEKNGYTNRIDQSANKRGWENRVNNLDKFIEENIQKVQSVNNTLPQTQSPIKHTWEGFEGLQLINNKYEYLVATSLLKNELGDVSNGYELSHAQTGKSGWSFGGHQMDLSINKEGMNLLKDIVTHHYGSSYWTPELEASLKVANSPNSISETTKEEINKALSSEYGRTKINENFVGSISQIVNHIDEVEKRLQEINPDIKLSNGEKLMLADYHNQYNLSLNSQSNGSMLKKLEDCVSKNGDISIEDIKSFFEETKYYIENRTSQSKRVNSTYQSAQELDKGEEASKEQQKSTTHTLEKPNIHSIDEIYKVQSGDTLSKIAQDNNTTIDKLIANNPWLEEKNRVSEDGNFVLIKVGEQLNLTNTKQIEDLEIKSLQRFISENGINFEEIKSFLKDMRQQNQKTISENMQDSAEEVKSSIEHRR